MTILQPESAAELGSRRNVTLVLEGFQMRNAVPVRHPAILASEAIQRKAWHLLSRAAPPDLAGMLGIQFEEIGSTLYQGTTGVPGAQFNKVFSFGVDDNVTLASIEQAADWLQRACGKQSLLMVPDKGFNHEHNRILLANGFQRFPLDITIFHMDVSEVPEMARLPSIDVRQVGPEQAETFGCVLSEGLQAPMAASWLAAFAVGHPGLTAYVAYEESRAIGAGALFIEGEWGWLFIAAVHPAFRNRGAQTALLARRIEDGRKAGVRTFNIGAFRPVPGHADVFASYRNIERIGFKFAYNRPNYVVPESGSVANFRSG